MGINLNIYPPFLHPGNNSFASPENTDLLKFLKCGLFLKKEFTPYFSLRLDHIFEGLCPGESKKDKNSAKGYVTPGKEHVSMTCNCNSYS